MLSGVNNIGPFTFVGRPIRALPSIAVPAAIKEITVFAFLLRKFTLRTIVISAEKQIRRGGVRLAAIDASPRKFALQEPLVSLIAPVNRWLDRTNVRGFWVVKKAHRFEISANLPAITPLLLRKAASVSKFFSKTSS